MSPSNGHSNGTSAPGSFPLIYPENREFTGGDLLAQTLKHLGVSVAFGIHGGHLDAFLTGCDVAGIRLVDSRHEQASVNAAEGYAKVTGKVGVCFATANSGWGNALPGLATAFADRSPIFCVTTSPPLRDLDSNSLQGFHDEVAVSKPITRYACRVTHAEEIPRLVAHAFRAAYSGAAMGPSLVDFPIDVLFSPVTVSQIAWGAISVPLPFPPGPHKDAVRDAIKRIKEAKRPVIIAGMQANFERVTAPLLKFAEATQIPVFHSLECTSRLPAGHPLSSGIANMIGFLPVIKEESPDLYILLGARTGMYLGNRGGSVIPKTGASIIQIDTDGSELGRSLPIDLAIVSDIEQALIHFNDALANETIKVAPEWTALATGLHKMKSPFEDQPDEFSPGRPHPFHAVKAVFKALQDGAIVSIDGGDISSWAYGALEVFTKPYMATMSTGYLGFLGNGWGYSIGYAVGAPDRQIVNIHGDGSAGFHIVELDTYARHNLNILTIVFNNYCWGMSINGQDLLYGEKTPNRMVSKLSPDANYDVVASGLGVRSAKIDKVSEIAAVVKEFISTPGPSCINLIISNKPTHPGTEQMVSPSDDPNVIVVPYYENVPRPFFR